MADTRLYGCLADVGYTQADYLLCRYLVSFSSLTSISSRQASLLQCWSHCFSCSLQSFLIYPNDLFMPASTPYLFQGGLIFAIVARRFDDGIVSFEQLDRCRIAVRLQHPSPFVHYIPRCLTTDVALCPSENMNYQRLWFLNSILHASSPGEDSYTITATVVKVVTCRCYSLHCAKIAKHHPCNHIAFVSRWLHLRSHQLARL